MSASTRVLGNPPRCDATPFRDAAEAWFWTMRAVVARGGGSRHPAITDCQCRPCDLDDVINAVATLYRRRGIGTAHARVLRIWGARQRHPCPQDDRADYAVWREAITLLEFPLRAKGIVA